MTYIRNLTEKMRDKPFQSMVVWGNPWNGLVTSPWGNHVFQAFPIFHDGLNYGWGDYDPMATVREDRPISSLSVYEQFWVSPDEALEAKNYRFDLNPKTNSLNSHGIGSSYVDHLRAMATDELVEKGRVSRRTCRLLMQTGIPVSPKGLIECPGMNVGISL